MKKVSPLLIAAIFAIQTLTAQNVQLSPTVISSAGNYSEAGNISLSWTLGEVAVSTLQQGDVILTQGFQQPFLKDVGFKLNPIDWKIIAYPNPVTDELRIQFDLMDTKDFIVEIQDVTGKLISQQQYKSVFPGDVVVVGMESYAYGIYFFRVSTTDKKQVRVLNISKL